VTPRASTITVDVGEVLTKQFVNGLVGVLEFPWDAVERLLDLVRKGQLSSAMTKAGEMFVEINAHGAQPDVTVTIGGLDHDVLESLDRYWTRLRLQTWLG
jgi:hypothetical protein